MGQLFSSICHCWSTSFNQQPQPTNSEPDERTPLIFDPPQPRPPPQPIPDTAQQLADEAAANKIVDDTVRCLVHVYSQAPFSHLSIDHQVPDSSHTPDGSTGTWRAYDPPICPPISPEIRRLRLGYDQPSSSDISSQNTGLNQKCSYHSLKTMVNHSLRTVTPASTRTNPASNLSSPADIEGSNYQNLPEPTNASDTQYDTITSFQTALDDTPALDQSFGSLPDSRPPRRPDFVGQLWPDLPMASEPAEGGEYLTDDPKALQALYDSGYRLPDPGPIFVDL
ncbi:hypothetical protein CROQUDRAFT_75258 [Cronartium quercuum f. sp. fusiforme G11]|uniref:Uncharacterized protein n=1 Tax=Cronartium quercuum f. sp. fusiforme G11 TaxID=708437 RepID=A0A9P6NM89_9BASI|nr:hypothetical protein CROQUDRAFT_75258 [Cronartium quercuum f. sp. fusiforme G11]